MSPEIASDDGTLFAGHQILFGRDLARLLGLGLLGNRTGGECGVGAGLVFAAVGRARGQGERRFPIAKTFAGLVQGHAG